MGVTWWVVYNEIDHIIVNRKFCLTDVRGSTRGQTTDRLLRARFRFSVRGERAAKFRRRSHRTVVNWDHFASLASLREDSVSDNIDDEYDRLVEHLHETTLFEDSRADTPAWNRASSCNNQLTSKLAKLCRAIKEGLKARGAAVLSEAAESGKSIHKARGSFVNYKTKMTSLHSPEGTVTASRRAMEKVIRSYTTTTGSLRQPRPPAYLPS
ncbi:unnamed protein product [Haemonchus placei]|uniref:Reverse transcriptase domain-containing protein n=1 Tax=Haemonchus placei TaxID=6290 RepID=A0A0N4WCW5_HAEPC|nr:unnamed protein product [Haemonchus placei]